MNSVFGLAFCWLSGIAATGLLFADPTDTSTRTMRLRIAYAFVARCFELNANCVLWTTNAEVLPTETRVTGESRNNRKRARSDRGFLNGNNSIRVDASTLCFGVLVCSRRSLRCQRRTSSRRCRDIVRRGRRHHSSSDRLRDDVRSRGGSFPQRPFARDQRKGFGIRTAMERSSCQRARFRNKAQRVGPRRVPNISLSPRRDMFHRFSTMR